MNRRVRYLLAALAILIGLYLKIAQPFGVIIYPDYSYISNRGGWEVGTNGWARCDHGDLINAPPDIRYKEGCGPKR